MNFSSEFVKECIAVSEKLNFVDIEKVVVTLADIRAQNGRLFIIGSGGGAGNASNAACDFMKLFNIDSYAPYDNISELTARVNDDGWDTTILDWLKVSRLRGTDGILVFSVGGGNVEKNISSNIVKALQYAQEVGAKITGVVGKDGGFTKEAGTAVIIIPTINTAHITPITEGFQALIWHLLVSHPKLQRNPTKWESTK